MVARTYERASGRVLRYRLLELIGIPFAWPAAPRLSPMPIVASQVFSPAMSALTEWR